VSTARELHRRGVAAINAGKVSVARQLLERALGADPDTDTTARIEISLAYCLAETGDHASGLDLCDRALARSPVTEQTRGLAHSQRGLLQMRSGNTSDAFESFSRAIDLLGGNPEGLARAFLNRGGVYLQQGRHEAAAEDFAQATRHFRDAGLPTEEAKAQHNAGYALFLAGDLVSALKSMEAAYPVFAATSPVLKAIAEQDRAETLLAAGMVAPGVALLRAAAGTYGKRGLRQRQGEAELTLARSVTVSQPALAARAGRAASRHFTTTGGSAWRIRADAVVLAAEVELGRAGPSLLTRGDELIRELDTQGLYWGAASVRLHTARVMVRRGDFDGASRRLGRVRMDDSAPLAVRLLARDVRAELASAQGRRAAALMQLRQGLEELHAWQSSFGSLDLQTMVIGNGVRLAKQALQLAVESGRPDVVFEWSERARMLASRVQPVRAELDDELAADLSELRALQGSEDGPRIPSPRRDRDEELRQRVRERAWRLQGSGEVTDPASLHEVQSALGTTTALVAWVVTPARVTGLVVTDRGSRVLDLGPREALDDLLDGLLPDLDVAASELPEILARSVRAQLADRLAALADLLVSPLVDLVGDREVVLTPSGVLAGVPWTLLDGFGGRPVTVARSATSWLGHREGLLRTAGFVAGPRVARAEDEVTEASLCWDGAQVLIGDKATTDHVRDLAAAVDVLHLAAHGRHSGDNPLFSGVECVDGPWFGYDIDQLETVPQVVVLSACEVGRSSVRYGEELIGMTAAWLHAGVGAVVASAAAVSDEIAHEVLTAFHRGLAEGLTPEAALAVAVPAVSEDRPPAPFVCFR